MSRKHFTVQQLYLVASVREIKNLLKAAKASQRLARKANDPTRDNHCVVLRMETAPGWADQGAEQISAPSFNIAIANLK